VDMQGAPTSGHHTHIPEDGVILSPRVEILRKGTDHGYQLLMKPVEVTAVISVAMFNRNPAVRDAPCDAPTDPAQYEAGVEKKLAAMFHAAILSGADTMILPDVGCGVFHNDPAVVGRLAGKLLRDYMPYLRLVVFTGRKEFFAAASDAVKTPMLSRPLKCPDSIKPRNTCIVCGKRLGRDLAVLLGPDGAQATDGPEDDKDQIGQPVQFLHAGCSKDLAERWPGHQAMLLPEAARDPASFLKAVDVNGTGQIEKEELRCVVAALWTGDPEKMDAEFEAKWAQWDKDSSGSLCKEELDRMKDGSDATLRRGMATRDLGRLSVQENDQLPAALLDWIQLQAFSASDALREKVRGEYKQASQERLMVAFRKWDSNGDGTIDKSQLCQLLLMLDPTASDDTVGTLFEEADLSKDGKISYQEFIGWVTSRDA